MKDIILSTIFILVGVLTRTVIHFGPNFEFITAIAIMSGYLMKSSKLAIATPLIAMAITDVIIGNSNIFLFTWSAYAVAPIIGMIIKKFKLKNQILKMLTVEAGGMLSAVFFFLWTNLGVVFTTAMYSKDLNGVIASYINGIPFFKPQLAGVLITVPLVYLVSSLIYKFSFRISHDKSILASPAVGYNHSSGNTIS